MNEKEQKLIKEVVNMIEDEFSEWSSEFKYEVTDINTDQDFVHIEFQFKMLNRKRNLSIKKEDRKYWVDMGNNEYSEKFETFDWTVRYLYLALMD